MRPVNRKCAKTFGQDNYVSFSYLKFMQFHVACDLLDFFSSSFVFSSGLFSSAVFSDVT